MSESSEVEPWHNESQSMNHSQVDWSRVLVEWSRVKVSEVEPCYFILSRLYFTLFVSTSFYQGSTAHYLTPLCSTIMMALLHFTCKLQWLYLTLLYSTMSQVEW